MKKNHTSYVRETLKTGGGPPPKPVPEEDLAVATGALCGELVLAEDQFDSMAPIVLSEDTVGMYYPFFFMYFILYLFLNNFIL